jgi:hypothetical protein
MPTTWEQAELQRHMDNKVEESLTLDYKAGDALGTSDGKKREITKDVSAMANSAGGIIIYGIKEYDEDDKKHLPEKFTPIDRTQFSKEWLEQIINSIQPRINGIIIHSVDLNTGSNDVAYVVEIPQGTTAHQAKDKRYYKRFNFLSEAMEDYEIRDVMNRQTLPDVTVQFGSRRNGMRTEPHYFLTVKIINQGVLTAEKYKLHFLFYVYDGAEVFISSTYNNENWQGSWDKVVHKDGIYADSYEVIFRSKEVLFPNDEIELTGLFDISYLYDSLAKKREKEDEANGIERKLFWTIYADNMPPKSGAIPFSTLHWK